MYRGFVPERLRPWLFLLVAFAFQMSGGIYPAALDTIEGQRCFMREDCLMTLYMNMLGLALGFPLLFRTKFRFTNKQLLCASAIGVIAEQLICMYSNCLPVIWLAAFLGGVCKIQGTFECMSNIQLWMSPTRDFRIFFPILHIIVLGSVCVCSMTTAVLTYHIGWQAMHRLVILLMLLCLMFFTSCLRSFHHIPNKQPFTGIDWTGAMLLATFFAQALYILTYGDWAGWSDSATIRLLFLTSSITLLLWLWRTFSTDRPFVELRMWTYPHVIPILLITILFESLLASERVLEEIYIGEVMNYGMMTHQLHFGTVGTAGILSGCLFAYWWLAIRRYRLLPLLAIGISLIIAYLFEMYTTMSPEINIGKLYPAVFCRQFATATLGICLLTAVQSLVGFMHFFQCLAVFQSLHLCCGSAIGGAVYGEAFRCYVSLNFARYGEAITATTFSRSPFNPETFIPDRFLPEIMAAALKTIYGWTIYVAIFTLLAILLYDLHRRHRRLQRFLWIPSWKTISIMTSKLKYRKMKTTYIIILLSLSATMAKAQIHTLQDLFLLAEQHSRRISISIAALSAAKESTATARTLQLPDINTRLSVGYNGRGIITDRDFSDAMNVYIPEYGNSFSLQVSQVLYAGGAVRNTIRLSEMGQQMAELDVERNRQEVRLYIIGKYLDILKTRNTIKVIDRNITLAEQLMENVRTRVRQGTALDNDITRHELRIRQLRLQRRKLDDACSVLNRSLCLTVGLPTETVIRPDTSLLSEPTATSNGQQWQQLAHNGNIGLRQAALAAGMAEKRVRLAQSASLPKLSIVAEDHLNGPITIEVPPINKNLNYWFVGIGLQYNISSLYKSRHDVRRARFARSESAHRLLLAEEEVSNGVYAAHTDYLTSLSEVETCEKQDNWLTSTTMSSAAAITTDSP